MGELKRGLSLWDTFIMSLTATVGAGIFVLPGELTLLTGSSIVLVFVLMGMIDSLNGLCYAELGAAFPMAGGSYNFAYKAMGPFFGFMVGWMMWTGNSAAISFYASGFAYSLQYFLPWIWTIPVAITTILFFTMLNLKGISEVGKAENWLTYIQMFFLALFVASMIPKIQPENFEPFGPPSGDPFDIAKAMGLMVIMFVGNEFVASAGGEIEDAAKAIPMAMLGALAASIFIYVAVFGAFVGGVGVSHVLQMEEEGGTLSLIKAARRTALGEFMATGIAVSAVVSCLSSLLATFVVATRMFYALARDAHFPRIFGAIDSETGIPKRAIIFCSMLAVVFALFGNPVTLAAISDYGFCFGTGLVNYTVIPLRKKFPHVVRPFKTPFYPYTVYAAVFFNIVFVPVLIYLEPMAIQVGLVFTAIGIATYMLGKRAISADRKIRKIEKFLKGE